MKELELLGLQPDGKHLTLNDAEGNRYALAITSELRGALRRDRGATPRPDHTPRAMSPREIQAYIREGKSVQEVSELASLPPSRIDAFAYPILEERRYAAKRACAITMGHEAGAMTLEELVTTRLAARGVKPADIEWDSLRRKGEPWTVLARYVTAERDRVATWHVDLDAQTCEAIDEEAVWLSETPLTAETAWRAPNTPPAPVDDPLSIDTASEESSTRTPLPGPSPEADTEPPAVAASDSRIDAVLASLDSQRGVPSLTPPTAGTPEELETAADVLSLPPRPSPQEAAGNSAEPAGAGASPEPGATEPTAETSDTANTDSASARHAGAFSLLADTDLEGTPRPFKKIRRQNRPSVPTWDEIVFGRKD